MTLETLQSANDAAQGDDRERERSRGLHLVTAKKHLVRQNCPEARQCEADKAAKDDADQLSQGGALGSPDGGSRGQRMVHRG